MPENDKETGLASVMRKRHIKRIDTREIHYWDINNLYGKECANTNQQEIC